MSNRDVLYTEDDDNGSIVLSDAESVSSVASSTTGRPRRRRRNPRVNQLKDKYIFGSELTVRELTFLQRDENKLAVEVRARKQLIQKLLEEDDLSSGMMTSLLDVLLTLSRKTGDDAREVFHFMTRMKFVEIHLLLYVLDRRVHPILCGGGDTLRLISVLMAFLMHDPNSTENVQIISAVIEDTLRYGNVVIDKITLQECRDIISELLSKGKPEMKTSGMTRTRSTPIFPTGGELVDSDVPELGRITHEQDPSVENYLDVHYQLLREDIVEPLRKVISTYHQVKRMNGLETAKKQCHVYSSAHFVDVITSHTSKGVTFRVQFDTSNTGYVSWETTKRLSFGTMVCLTNSHFHHVIYATVAKRDPQWLGKGFVDLRLFSQEDIATLMSGVQFFMIDSQRYVEESYEVLEAMKHINSDTLPLAQHVVYQSAEDEVAIHLKRDSHAEYDVGSLLKDESTGTRRVAQRTWRTPLLEPEKWPPASQLDVDEHQLRAIQAAFTKQVTVITGSPGTGKTYVALKLAQLFLLNGRRWNNPGGKNGRPLMFMCATKAGLDEFLAGVTYFQRTGIVRCGGPQTRKILQAYQLEKHREKYTSSTAAKDQSCNEEMERCKKKLVDIQANIAKLSSMVLPEEILKVVMHEAHYRSLIKQKDCSAQAVILEWLLSSDIDDQGLRNITEGVPFNVSRFVCREEDLDSLLERQLPFVLNSQSPGIAGKTREITAKELRSKEKMGAAEKKQVTDVWSLSKRQRWCLYREWNAEIEARCQLRCKKLFQEMEQIAHECQKAHDDVDESILGSASLIGMTASSAAKLRRVLQRVSPRVVILEEAADILHSTTAALLPAGCEQLILIGEAAPKVDQLQAVKKMASAHDIDASLLQQLINNDYSVYKLETQHRMSPNVSKISRQVLNDDYQSHQSVIELPGIPGFQHSIFFIEHCDHTSPATTEALFLLALFELLLEKGFTRKQISILTPFKAQQNLFKGKVNDRLLPIDNFRGGNDIILFMCNGSERESKPGCLLRDQRLASMLTRARRGLYIIGDFTFLASRCQFWARLLDEARRMELVDTCLKLTCPHHPSIPTSVSTVEEFEQYKQKRGCGLPCQVRLECGHCCKEPCHSHDLERDLVVCKQPCSRSVCENNHKCTRLCSEPCDTQCRGKVDKQLPCGHHQLLPCHLQPNHATCSDKCERILNCGHKCTGICGKPCKKDMCVEKTVKSGWPCRHSVEVRCCDGPETCPEPCNVVLACSHPCSGTCGKCRRGRLHVACQQPCGRTLVCGHSCESNCSARCPPCPKVCENRCQHSKCTKICGEACISCREACLWRCHHISCPKLCGEPCERKPCDEPCQKTLPCGHPCIGMCGERCPTKCRICNREEVTEILFGSEDEDDARFVQLEDCGHIIEVESMDQYMSMSQESDDAVNIQLKGCPKCKTPIRRNLRYGNIIKQTLADVESVKTIIRGDETEIGLELGKLKRMKAVLRRHLAYRDEFIDEEDLTKLEAGLTRMRHLDKVLARLNRCMFLKALADTKAKMTGTGSIFQLATRERRIDERLDELKNEIVDGEIDRFTEQQMNDLQREICRVNLQALVINVLKRNIPSLHSNLQSSNLNAFDDLVYQDTPFTKEDEGCANHLVRKIKRDMGHVVLGISEQERVQIVRAIGLSQGHWYKCPKGHVYAIGECGGAMEQAICPECGVSIGGESHRLTSGNRVATEMDGASRAAWPMGDFNDDYEDDVVQDMDFDQGDIQEQFEIERQIREARELEERRIRERERVARQNQQRERRERAMRLEQERRARENVERARIAGMQQERMERAREQAEREREREKRMAVERERHDREQERMRLERERVATMRLLQEQEQRRRFEEEERMMRAREGARALLGEAERLRSTKHNAHDKNCTVS